ncbi:AraC family transcriptional regulator [Parabacteroides goldsteinii]|uniref:AraC family transcriptional regulator n=1 Tax=Parabacteroides goldsteinii TaxID=328812 RepID=UPI00260243C1|nr:AraC family transcriptional regulator [Parabacteroides goldsteinii]
MANTTLQDHTKQINRVIDYINSNLNRQISIDELSSLVDISTYHFHRIFTASMAEPVGKYILRRRLERAANVLLSDPAAIKDVAYDWGFSSASSFCRSFKSINEQHTSLYSRYFCRDKTIKVNGMDMNCTFEIKQMPERAIIYCRHQGALDQMQEAFANLMKWALPRGFVSQPDMRLLSVYHDDPRVTPVDKLTADAAMFVPEEMKPEGIIGSYKLSGGLYAVGRFELSMSEFPAAWMAMFDLLEENGCKCGYGHHYEIYQNNHDEHPEKKFIVDICIPVEPV